MFYVTQSKHTSIVSVSLCFRRKSEREKQEKGVWLSSCLLVLGIKCYEYD